MSSDLPTKYDQITAEEEATIDAICDRFEQAWREAGAGGLKPSAANYVVDCQGAAREVLVQELVALEQACQERYDSVVPPSTPKGLELAGEVSQSSPTLNRGVRAFGSVRRPADWPTIPGLTLLDVLGSGGMGVVFRARQATLNRDVAVKILRDDHPADSGQHDRFLQEARAIALLRHPHLVQVYEFGELSSASGALSRPYLVLEYVSGGSLADVLHGSPQSPMVAARLVETIAEAIHYAHQQGVIHRDLKPGNVLL